jgi:hypothetical protein
LFWPQYHQAQQITIEMVDKESESQNANDGEKAARGWNL